MSRGRPATTPSTLDVHGPWSCRLDALRTTVKLDADGRGAGHDPGDGGRTRARRRRRAAHRARASTRHAELPLARPARHPALVRRTVRPLEAGASLTVSSDLLADILPGTGAVSVSVSPLAGARRAGRCCRRSTAIPMAARSRSSAGRCRCSTSTSSPRRRRWRSTTRLDERVRDAIERVLARQDSNGAFGLWSVGGDDLWLDAYVTDFLTRARERGFAVPPARLRPRARPLAQLRRQHHRGASDKAPGSRLCGLCAGPQRPAGDGRSALPRRHQARRPSARRWRAPRSARRSRCSATGAASQTAFVSAVEQLRGSARTTGVYRGRLRLAPARRRRHPGARRRGRHRARDQCSASRASSTRSAAIGRTPARRRTPGWCWPRRRSPATRETMALSVDGARAERRRSTAPSARRALERDAGDASPTAAPRRRRSS